MAKPGTRKRGRRSPEARQRVVDAAIETLKAEGYAGASARAIAGRGGFSQGVVFYYFGSVRDLLLAALDETSERRMAAYRDAMEGVTRLDEVVDVAAQVYKQDLDEGHIKVLSEVIAATSTEPGLRDDVMERIEPWIRLTEETLARVLGGSPLEGVVPARQVAFAVVALYLGIELLTHLSGDRSDAEGLFGAASAATGFLGPLLGAAPPGSP